MRMWPIGDRFGGAGGRPAAGPRLLVAAALLLLAGCASLPFFGKAAAPARRDAEEWFDAADEAFERKKYEEARRDYQKIVVQYPESELVPAARLRVGETYYLEKKYDDAIGEYQKFLDLHPSHERADEALYMTGMSYYRQIDTVDRDQSVTRKALEAFESLLKTAPDSRFIPDAQAKMATGKRKLAEKEDYVGTFYFRRENYNAAALRFEQILTTYRGVGLDDRALYYLAESLWRLEQRERAATLFRQLIDEYPESDYLPPAGERLGLRIEARAARRTHPEERPSVLDRLRATWEEIKTTVQGFAGGVLKP
jgi:outer membrane protein assembly factor BamD